MKQVIVMRKDLDMPIGKAIAQGAHASEKAVTRMLRADSPDLSFDFSEWAATGRTKICVAVKSEDALRKIEAEANRLGIINSGIIVDEGRTVFDTPTPTCIAIGPGTNFNIDKVTKRLRLF